MTPVELLGVTPEEVNKTKRWAWFVVYSYHYCCISCYTASFAPSLNRANTAVINRRYAMKVTLWRLSINARFATIFENQLPSRLYHGLVHFKNPGAILVGAIFRDRVKKSAKISALAKHSLIPIFSYIDEDYLACSTIFWILTKRQSELSTRHGQWFRGSEVIRDNCSVYLANYIALHTLAWWWLEATDHGGNRCFIFQQLFTRIGVISFVEFSLEPCEWRLRQFSEFFAEFLHHPRNCLSCRSHVVTELPSAHASH